jgi:hypothetical protein
VNRLREQHLLDAARARAGFGEATEADLALIAANPVPPRPRRPLPTFAEVNDDEDLALPPPPRYLSRGGAQ